jgi:hypothetical protein
LLINVMPAKAPSHSKSLSHLCAEQIIKMNKLKIKYFFILTRLFEI